jgi:hypothetical protein
MGPTAVLIRILSTIWRLFASRLVGAGTYPTVFVGKARSFVLGRERGSWRCGCAEGGRRLRCWWRGLGLISPAQTPYMIDAVVCRQRVVYRAQDRPADALELVHGNGQRGSRPRQGAGCRRIERVSASNGWWSDVHHGFLSRTRQGAGLLSEQRTCEK